jgi:hypothetical protein
LVRCCLSLLDLHLRVLQFLLRLPALSSAIFISLLMLDTKAANLMNICIKSNRFKNLIKAPSSLKEPADQCMREFQNTENQHIDVCYRCIFIPLPIFSIKAISDNGFLILGVNALSLSLSGNT